MPLEAIIEQLSRRLLRLDTGSLAELRRMETGGPGPLAYWRLAVECGFIDEPPDRWMPIVRILAVLTSKGDRLPSDRLHDPKRRLGSVLCDGGDPGWQAGQEPRPFLSETRLARLLAAPAVSRAQAVMRIARMLAANRDRASGLDCREVAALLLFSDARDNPQKIAKAYYRRLDFAARQSEPEEVEQ